MPSFDAGAVVEPLNWDFTAFKAGKGTVPEPSDEKIAAFMKATMALAQTEGEAGAGLAALADAGEDPEKMLTAIAALPEDVLSGAKALIPAYAALCSGCPSAVQLGKLPPRVRYAFFTWLAGELRPEASAGAGKPALRSVS
jgi:hypothetical protein